MDLDRDSSNADDENFVTALQIFEICGVDSSGVLHVDALMDKMTPCNKSNNSEYSYLKSLLDPEQNDPEINVGKLARALNMFSDSQKTKVDLEESFNLKSGQIPQDSDSGISTEGFHMLEDLQCELREKTHLIHQLRSQLDFCDRQHEEALASITAERDSLRAHLNMLREENMSLIRLRHDYEEACDRLCTSDEALSDARKEVDLHKKKAKGLVDQAAALETEKLILQEQLNKSKDECHRINEMYLSRQSALREQNEALKAERADLSSRLQDQEEFLHQLVKEKVMLEMELKEVLNKCNQTQLRLDRSIDVSYTEDQMLTALDTINADSRFTTDNQILDDEIFVKVLNEDQGRHTNMSLYDEIRLSFSHVAKHESNDSDSTQYDKRTENLESSLITIGIQTEDVVEGICDDAEKNMKDYIRNAGMLQVSVGTQCEANSIFDTVESNLKDIRTMSTAEQSSLKDSFQTMTPSTQTIEQKKNEHHINNNGCGDCSQCLECEKKNKYMAKLKSDLKHAYSAVNELQRDMDKYEENLNLLQKLRDEGKERNCYLETLVQSMQSKFGILELVCSDQSAHVDRIACGCVPERDVASIATQVDVPCADCEKRNAVVPQHSFRKYLWEPLKCLFQVFAVVCFLCAASALYGVTRRWNARCIRDTPAVPWRWFDAQEFMDLLLRIEYVADVPIWDAVGNAVRLVEPLAN